MKKVFKTLLVFFMVCLITFSSIYFYSSIRGYSNPFRLIQTFFPIEQTPGLKNFVDKEEEVLKQGFFDTFSRQLGVDEDGNYSYKNDQNILISFKSTLGEGKLNTKVEGFVAKRGEETKSSSYISGSFRYGIIKFSLPQPVNIQVVNNSNRFIALRTDLPDEVDDLLKSFLPAENKEKLDNLLGLESFVGFDISQIGNQLRILSEGDDKSASNKDKNAGKNEGTSSTPNLEFDKVSKKEQTVEEKQLEILLTIVGEKLRQESNEINSLLTSTILDFPAYSKLEYLGRDKDNNYMRIRLLLDEEKYLLSWNKFLERVKVYISSNILDFNASCKSRYKVESLAQCQELFGDKERFSIDFTTIQEYLKLNYKTFFEGFDLEYIDFYFEPSSLSLVASQYRATYDSKRVKTIEEINLDEFVIFGNNNFKFPYDDSKFENPDDQIEFNNALYEWQEYVENSL